MKPTNPIRIALALCTGAAVFGQTPADEPIELEAVTVSTSKLARTLHDYQESIAVITGEVIDDRNLQDLEDVFNQTANAYNMTGEGFGIRGITHNSQATGGGDGELASYYIDGVAFTGFSKRFGPQDLWDAEQIEVLRGPQSTNVGRNALAGAVSVRTKDPVLYQESAFRAGIAEYDTYKAAGMYNTPTGDQSALRLVASYDETRGFVSNPTIGTDDYDARDNTVARAKWMWTSPDPEKLRVLFSLQYADTYRGQQIVSLDDADARENFSNLPAFETNESWTATADVTAKINDLWNVTSVTSWITADYERFDDDDQGPGGFDAFRGRTATDENWAEELRFGFDNGDQFRGVIGLFYTEVDLENLTDGKVNIQPALVGVPAPLLPFYPELIGVGLSSTFYSQTTNTALFTEWEYDVSDRWNFYVGARYDREDEDRQTASETVLLSQLPDPTTPGLPPPVAGGIAAVNGLLARQLQSTTTDTSTSFDAFLPQVGVTYNWSDDVNTGFLVKQGYRAGGADLNIVGALSEYDPEFLTNYELSLRSRMLDGAMTLNANIYYGDWQDQQVLVQQSANTLDVITENAGESEIYGAEVEMTYRVNPRAHLFASLGYSHTEFVEFVSPTGDYSGNRFALAPEESLAVGGTFGLTDRINFHANVTYQSDTYADVQNTIPLDDFTLVNVRLSYDTEKWSARIYASNLFDELYVQSAFQSLAGTPLGVVGAPRVVGFEFTSRF